MRIRHPLILTSVCLGYFMAVLDSTVVNVALPDMARGLQAVLNASRQVGGVIGIALLGALIGGHGHFMTGMHRGMVVSGALFLIGSGLSLQFVERRVRGAQYAVASDG